MTRKARRKAMKKRRRGHGPKGKSVDLSVHLGVARQLDQTRVELAQAVNRVHNLEALLIAVVRAAGGILDVDFLPEWCEFGIESERRDGGVILILTGTEKPPEGQEGKADADDDRVGDGDVESGDGLHADQPRL